MSKKIIQSKPAASAKPAAAREAAKQASREAIIAAARALMPRRGLDVSLDELCAHAGYTRGAFYVHFKTRDDLTLAVMDRVGAELLDALLGPEKDGPADDLMAVVRRFLPAMFSGEYPLTRKGGMRPHQLLDACARSPEIRARYVALTRSSIQRLAKSIAQSQRKNRMRKDINADQTAALMLALVIGVHTMYDLDVPMDFVRGSMTLLKLLGAKPF